ncbi:hypothetical protein B0O80DRAFT_496779 [Mortierella sp. GBAus27b]|nr:hypothetical protein BGX31_004504 [Mortierella sp. GBA43]KAI8357058.1 hypothetical protein B0O80DRAFT_496779 [Mortierella sp. GBAus27b]
MSSTTPSTPPMQDRLKVSSTSTYEQDQELFADTLLKLQINSALVKENVHKSPGPLLAQSCSLLDNLPARSPHWTPAQQSLIASLKIDAWVVFADECVKAKDWIQAEASLQRLSTLQDNAAGPLSHRFKPNKRRDGPVANNPAASSTSPTGSGSGSRSGSGSGSNASSADLISGSSSLASTTSAATEITKEHYHAAKDLLQTWDKLRLVHENMGHQEMANNFTKRIAKMKERLQALQLEPE